MQSPIVMVKEAFSTRYIEENSDQLYTMKEIVAVVTFADCAFLVECRMRRRTCYYLDGYHSRRWCSLSLKNHWLRSGKENEWLKCAKTTCVDYYKSWRKINGTKHEFCSFVLENFWERTSCLWRSEEKKQEELDLIDLEGFSHGFY